MAAYEREINASFTEVEKSIRRQLFDKSRCFKVREKSTYKKDDFEILVMSIEPHITLTIAGTENSTWVSVIGCDTGSRIKIRSGFDMQPDILQLISASLRCYQA